MMENVRKFVEDKKEEIIVVVCEEFECLKVVVK